MPGGLRQRAGLAPARHAAIDQLRVAGMALRRAQAQLLGHAGAKALYQNVSVFHQAQHDVHRARVFHVE